MPHPFLTMWTMTLFLQQQVGALLVLLLYFQKMVMIVASQIIHLTNKTMNLDWTKLFFVSKTSFENPNGECLEGTELVDYLVTTNKKLAEKVESYRKKCEETEDQSYEKEIKCQQKIKSIRHFYRNLILLSNSRSAINVKKISFPAIMIMDIL